MMKIHMQGNGLRTATACGESNPYLSMVSRAEFAELLNGKARDDVEACRGCAHIAELKAEPVTVQGDPLENFSEVGPEWAAVVKRLRAAQDNHEGIVLTARDVEVLNRALKALAKYIIDGLKVQYAAVFRATGSTDSTKFGNG